MTLMNIGSIAARVQNLLANIPTNISGEVVEVALQQLQHCSDVTGETIDSTNIAVKFQPPILLFTLAEISDLMTLQGAIVDNVRLGELSVSQSASRASDNLRNSANEKLKALGVEVKTFKSNYD